MYIWIERQKYCNPVSFPLSIPKIHSILRKQKLPSSDKKENYLWLEEGRFKLAWRVWMWERRLCGVTPTERLDESEEYSSSGHKPFARSVTAPSLLTSVNRSSLISTESFQQDLPTFYNILPSSLTINSVKRPLTGPNGSVRVLSGYFFLNRTLQDHHHF